MRADGVRGQGSGSERRIIQEGHIQECNVAARSAKQEERGIRTSMQRSHGTVPSQCVVLDVKAWPSSPCRPYVLLFLGINSPFNELLRGVRSYM